MLMMHTHSNHLVSIPQAPKTFTWMLMMRVSSLWSLNALRWRKALSLFGPRITRLSQTPHAWPLSMNGASKYHVFPVSHATFLGPEWLSFADSSFLTCCSHVSLSPGQELSSTVFPWRIWALSPVWSLTLMASPPATHLQRRVSLPTVLASLPLCTWNLILVICLGDVRCDRGSCLLYCFNSCIKSTSATPWGICVFVLTFVSVLFI